jgi:hypothetical protein
MDLVKLCLHFAESEASLHDFPRAYESKTLLILKKFWELDPSSFETNGILCHQPNLEVPGTYRLIAWVDHRLSGWFCYCCRPTPNGHPKVETHLSRESDDNYELHGTNPWERWQLHNFYKHIFKHPSFNARKMQDAKRHSDYDKLEKYLESLVPDFS